MVPSGTHLVRYLAVAKSHGDRAHHGEALSAALPVREPNATFPEIGGASMFMGAQPLSTHTIAITLRGMKSASCFLAAKVEFPRQVDTLRHSSQPIPRPSPSYPPRAGCSARWNRSATATRSAHSGTRRGCPPKRGRLMTTGIPVDGDGLTETSARRRTRVPSVNPSTPKLSYGGSGMPNFGSSARVGFAASRGGSAGTELGRGPDFVRSFLSRPVRR